MSSNKHKLTTTGNDSYKLMSHICSRAIETFKGWETDKELQNMLVAHVNAFIDRHNLHSGPCRGFSVNFKFSDKAPKIVIDINIPERCFA